LQFARRLSGFRRRLHALQGNYPLPALISLHNVQSTHVASLGDQAFRRWRLRPAPWLV